jgi:dUTP pyrophosphatase
MKPEVNIAVQRLHPEARLPRYAHTGVGGDLAADLYSVADLEVQPGTVIAIPTGIAVEIPDDFGGIVEDRSSTAVKGLTTLAGVIDPNYRGEIRIVVTNVGQNAVKICKGDRIAQIRIVHRIEASFFETSNLSPTPRQAGGFGSTGE